MTMDMLGQNWDSSILNWMSVSWWWYEDVGDIFLNPFVPTEHHLYTTYQGIVADNVFITTVDQSTTANP